MKKIFYSTLLVCSISYAQNHTFAGIEFGQTKVSASANSLSFDSNNETSFSIKFGQENTEYRIYGKYLNCDLDGETMHVVSLNYDKYFKTNDFKPFIGGTIGYLNYSEDEANVELSGITYGIRTGLITDFSDKLSGELGYSYVFTSATDNMSVYGQNIEIGFDDYSTFNIGLNYRF